MNSTSTRQHARTHASSTFTHTHRHTRTHTNLTTLFNMIKSINLILMKFSYTIDCTDKSLWKEKYSAIQFNSNSKKLNFKRILKFNNFQHGTKKPVNYNSIFHSYMYTESYPLTATWQVLQFKLLIPTRIIALWNVHCDCLRKAWAAVL